MIEWEWGKVRRETDGSHAATKSGASCPAYRFTNTCIEDETSRTAMRVHPPTPATATAALSRQRPGVVVSMPRPPVLRSAFQFATRIFGGLQVPLPSGMIDGGSIFGQYSRMTTNMGPSGAGSQFDSFALPGESFWM